MASKRSRDVKFLIDLVRHLNTLDIDESNRELREANIELIVQKPKPGQNDVDYLSDMALNLCELYEDQEDKELVSRLVETKDPNSHEKGFPDFFMVYSLHALLAFYNLGANDRDDNYTPLHFRKAPDAVRYLIEERHFNGGEYNEEGFNGLYYQTDLESIRYLIENAGLDIRRVSQFGDDEGGSVMIEKFVGSSRRVDLRTFEYLLSLYDTDELILSMPLPDVDAHILLMDKGYDGSHIDPSWEIKTVNDAVKLYSTKYEIMPIPDNRGVEPYGKFIIKFCEQHRDFIKNYASVINSAKEFNVLSRISYNRSLHARKWLRDAKVLIDDIKPLLQELIDYGKDVEVQAFDTRNRPVTRFAPARPFNQDDLDDFWERTKPYEERLSAIVERIPLAKFQIYMDINYEGDS